MYAISIENKFSPGFFIFTGLRPQYYWLIALQSNGSQKNDSNIKIFPFSLKCAYHLSIQG